MAGRIPEEIIQEILDKTDILDVINDHVKLQRRGARYLGLCPFHHEKTPSFSVTPDKGLFYCFGCQKGGNALSFIMDLEGLTFREAVSQLAQKAGVTLPDTPQDQEDNREDSVLRDLYQRLSSTYQHFLWNDPQGRSARDYLSRRGLEEETVKAFGLGYAPADRRWLYRFLTTHNYSPEFLQKSGLFSRNYPEVSLFSHRLMFPIRDKNGRVVGFGGRLLQGEGPKYINSPETPIYKKNQVLYGLYESLDQIRREREFVLLEGYFDVIALYQAGIRQGVAPLGTAFTENQAHLLHRYARKGLLWLDSDRAGIEATFKASRLLEKHEFKTRVVQQPRGKDPADILEKEGAEALKKVLKYPINTFEYLLSQGLKEGSADSPESKEEVIHRIFSFIESIDSPIRRDGYLQQLAETVHIDVEAVRQDFRKRHNPTKQHTERNETSAEEGQPNSVDWLLMVAVWVNLDYFSYVRSSLELLDFKDPRARDLFIMFEEAFRREQLSQDMLINKIDGRQHQWLLDKAASGEFDVNPKDYIKDAVRTIKKRSLLEQINQLESKIRQLERIDEADQTDMRNLLLEKMYLDGELKKLRE